ncbi:hypothetical protein [Agaribacter marinus]|uniref:Uncharacterized protein n=1 Tax=Agaribacter marinus TaxID=1431249 RepID=A0AA37SWY1_9ALTE|nr:hypothetical protein [Agaribacter marinus]GLR69675.1 hypothetical protein GCM10007852_05830 [Agaribacter marinus]
MFEIFILVMFAVIHTIFAIKAAVSSVLVNNAKRGKWIALSLLGGFVGHFIYYSLQLDDEYKRLRS